MPGVILDDDVADLLELVHPAQDFHPNISQYDFLTPEFDLLESSFLVQYSIRHGPYFGRHFLAVNPEADI